MADDKTDVDEQGYEQGENPDYIAWHVANGAEDRDPLNVDPRFLAALEAYRGEALQREFAEKMAAQSHAPQFQPLYGAPSQPQPTPNVYGFVNQSAPPPVHQLSQLAALLQALQDK